MGKSISLTDQHWVHVYSSLSPRNKRMMKRYFKSVYPRKYIKHLIAILDDNVQSKEAQFFQ